MTRPRQQLSRHLAGESKRHPFALAYEHRHSTVGDARVVLAFERGRRQLVLDAFDGHRLT